MNQYLKETKMLDYSHKSIQKLIRERKWSGLPEKERVKEIYDFVKDEILFGYNTDDKIKASRVLKDGYGQCNTKGTLLMALLRACGIRFAQGGKQPLDLRRNVTLAADRNHAVRREQTDFFVKDEE